MVNIQVTHDSDINHARSESSLVVNPNNPSQIVAASKKFNDIHTYDFTLATEYSTDGGQTWRDSAAFTLPAGSTVMTDPTLAWDDADSVFLVGLVGKNPPAWNTIGIATYKSTDGGKTWSAPNLIHQSTTDDKQWAAGDSNPASPHHGNVYAVWDDSGAIDFARTKNHGTSWVGSGTSASPPIAATLTDGCYYPEINVADDGAVYVAAISGSDIHLHVSTDGGDTFAATPHPATGITPLGAALSGVDGFPVFPGGNFRVITDPTACASRNTVTVAWADYREGVSRIYFARSTDGGSTWTTGPSGNPLLTASFSLNFQHFHPQIVTDANGVIGCTFYEFGPKSVTYLIDVLMAQSFDGGATFNHFTVTDQPWNPTVDAPWSHGDSSVTFIGDYFGLDAGASGFMPLWTDTRTGIQELFTAIVPERNLEFVVNRSTIGQDEVDARRQFAGPSAVIPDAFRIVVDGYSAAQIGVTGPSSTLAIASPVGGLSVTCTGNVSANGDYGPEVQRLTFTYDLDFGTDTHDPAFSFGGATEFVTLNATVGNVSGSGQIELIKQPDPFMLHGDPAWLSVDLRVFVMRPGGSKFGRQMGSTAADATDFIEHVATDLTTGNGTVAGQTFDDPSVLSPDEEGSALYVYPTDDSSVPVFNFALARVRYIGLIGANDVRVFFRLFQAQTTSAAYDFPPGASYRRTQNPSGQPIPLAGIQGNEYVTLPFFALPRIDTTTNGMDKQTDSRTAGGSVLGNVQHITAHPDGTEVDTFFGCWLDINQPTVNVIPATKDAAHPDGPFQSVSNPPLPIQQAILKSLHQCLVAEVVFDPVVIPLGKDPGNWDKLAQRNLAWSDVGSATAVTPFEIRPTPVGLPSQQRADELMIDWGETPTDSVAMLYLPAVSADEILDMASRMYISHHLTRVDEHTLQCRTGGITYVPIPPGSGPDYAGLLMVDPPESLKGGREFTVVVRQVTNAFSARLRVKKAQDTGGEKKGRRKARPVQVAQEGPMGRSEYDYLQWRRVLGAFQLTAPVRPKQTLLFREERHLSVLRWIAEAIPERSRWHPVFDRYIDVIGDRVTVFGGDPSHVRPSPHGWPKAHPDHRPPGEARDGHTGKVAGLLFDRFGDFEGFVLETAEGERRYFSRERDIEALAERAWGERLRVTVFEERDDHGHAASIVIWEPPVHA